MEQIDVDLIKLLLEKLKGYDSKRIAHIVLSMMFEYAVKNKDNIQNLMLKIDKPKALPKRNKKKRTIVTREDEEIWLDKFGEENTDMSLIFEIMLLQRFP